ncbi:putative clathrin assembly protein [Tanacetum coccineum]
MGRDEPLKQLMIRWLNANIMKSLFGCDQGATGKKEDVVKERKDGTLKKISAGVDKFLKELSKIGSKPAHELSTKRQIAERLSEFYEICKNVNIGHRDRFIKIEQPPSSFLQAMEEYVTEAPRASNVRVNAKRSAITHSRHSTSVDHPSNNYSYYADTGVDDNHSVITHSRHVNAGQEGVATDVQQRSRKPDVALSDT